LKKELWGGLFDALSGNRELIANRAVARRAAGRTPVASTEYTIRGKVVVSPKFGPW